MSKPRGIIILAIIILFQCAVPFGMSGIERYQINQFEEKGKEVKILVDTVEYCDNRVWCYFDAFYNDARYIVLYERDDGYYVLASSSEKPGVDTYVTKSYYSDSPGFVYDVDKVLDDGDYTFLCNKDLYNKEHETDNIKHGIVEGPPTQAELVLKVYKGRYEIENIYIDGMTVEEVIEKAANGVYDLNRYFFYFYDSDEDYDDDLEEILTESVEEYE